MQYVQIGAGKSVEGICGSSDANLAKLVFSYPGGKSDDELKKIKQYTISTIVVSQQ